MTVLLFIMPSTYLLLGKMGIVGRGCAILFFACMVSVGLGTLVGLGDVSVRALHEAGGKTSPPLTAVELSVTSHCISEATNLSFNDELKLLPAPTPATG